MIFSGRRADAEEAHAIGLADWLVPAGTARTSALELASHIAANSPVAVRAAKQALRNGAGLSLPAALDVEDAAWRTAASSADRREGIAAFAEKRRPVWPGARGAQVPRPERRDRPAGARKGTRRVSICPADLAA
jgi:enoyl-CoA hydratase/carnithine racemase